MKPSGESTTVVVVTEFASGSEDVQMVECYTVVAVPVVVDVTVSVLFY